MSKKKFLLSVIIPTRNRALYANQVCNQILSMNCDDLELIVQDNSDTDSLNELLSSHHSNCCLKYAYTGMPLSFVENFSQAISRSTGEYICIIGDDDGLNPDVLPVVKWAKDCEIDAIVPTLRAVYAWPGSKIQDKFDPDDNGCLSINLKGLMLTGVIKSTKGELEKLLINGCHNYYNYHLVKLYHGIVKREFMNTIHEMTGHYIGGLSPDIYASVALTTLIEKALLIDFPLTIPGICSNSGTADSITGRHEGNIEEAPHFNGHINYIWAKEVPKFYSVETIWADSALAAIREMRREDLLPYYNIIRQAAFCLYNHFRYYDIIMSHLNAYAAVEGINFIRARVGILYNIIIGPIRGVFVRIHRRLRRNTTDVIRFHNVENINDAVNILTEYMTAKYPSFQIRLEDSTTSCTINNKIQHLS